jgi:hypothetical protein
MRGEDTASKQTHGDEDFDSANKNSLVENLGGIQEKEAGAHTDRHG